MIRLRQASAGLALLAAALLSPRAAHPGRALVQAPAAATAPAGGAFGLPMRDGSVRFAVIGDCGRGDRGQYDTAKELTVAHDRFPFTFAVMVGDNIYGADAPADFTAKFETPYKPLLDGGVKFYAALGNHDNPNQRFYKLYNMGGERYYTFRASAGGLAKLGGGGVRFFALDSNYVDKPQLDWLEKQLAASGSDWKIAFFHHPLYSSGRTHGSALETRAVLEPLFLKYGVNVVLTGHDHIYERIKPQKGIYHWVVGSTGSIRKGDLTRTDLTEKGFDTDYVFMLAEIAGDDLSFAALSRTGVVVDSGVVKRPSPSPAPATPAPAASPTIPPPSSPEPSLAPRPSPAASPSPKAGPSPSPRPSPKPSRRPRPRKPGD